MNWQYENSFYFIILFLSPLSFFYYELQDANNFNLIKKSFFLIDATTLPFILSLSIQFSFFEFCLYTYSFVFISQNFLFDNFLLF